MRNENITSETDARMIKVLLADDHAIVRQGLRAVLETATDIEIIGEAENGRQAVSETRRLQPDVVLLDLAMPLLNGIEAARQIAHEVPTARVLILSSYSDHEHLRRAVEVGVAGYLRKESSSDALLETVRGTHRGEALFSSPLSNHLLETWREGMRGAEGAVTGRIALSQREAEVLQMVAEGYGTKQIAGVLSIGQKTVQKHRQSVMEKLKLHKVATLTRYAVAAGLVESNRKPDWMVKQPRSRPHLRASKKALMM
jgi:DNA-binding NarL/FixJ family response regulator